MDCIQRKIVVRPCPTTISSCFEGFSDDHFAVTLKPLCGERGIRTPGTSQFNGFQDRRNRPLCHLSMVNFTPPKAHPQGRVGGLTDAKIVYFGEFARADLSERAVSPSWGGGEKGESWELLPRLLAGEVVPL